MIKIYRKRKNFRPVNFNLSSEKLMINFEKMRAVGINHMHTAIFLKTCVH